MTIEEIDYLRHVADPEMFDIYKGLLRQSADRLLLDDVYRQGLVIFSFLHRIYDAEAHQQRVDKDGENEASKQSQSRVRDLEGNS